WRRWPLPSADPAGAPVVGRPRAGDMSRFPVHLDGVEGAGPGLAGRGARDAVGVVGHSMGGHTASVLLGARHGDATGGTSAEPESEVADPRIRAGVLLAAPGRGDALSDFARAHYSFLSSLDFSAMRAPALVVAGDADDHPFMKTVGAAWHADPYHLAPGPKALLTLPGG